jgi:hypothetical protein
VKINWRAVNAAVIVAGFAGGLVLATSVDGYSIAPVARFWLTIGVGTIPTLTAFLPAPIRFRGR